jgi:hypothetical protein
MWAISSEFKGGDVCRIASAVLQLQCAGNANIANIANIPENGVIAMVWVKLRFDKAS